MATKTVLLAIAQQCLTKSKFPCNLIIVDLAFLIVSYCFDLLYCLYDSRGASRQVA